ncbi:MULTISPECIES: hypothetical protein [unclassified Clostridioides]|uniref:hypothetical protein n=1 Tax=unclassified Clostridioides TaxID=2635829 RepID=UPI001D0F67BF
MIKIDKNDNEKKQLKDSLIGFLIKSFILNVSFIYMNNHMEASIMTFSLPSGKTLFSVDGFPILKFLLFSSLLIEFFILIIDMMNYYIKNL